MEVLQVWHIYCISMRILIIFINKKTLARISA